MAGATGDIGFETPVGLLYYNHPQGYALDVCPWASYGTMLIKRPSGNS